jgi:hypothetical protein
MKLLLLLFCIAGFVVFEEDNQTIKEANVRIFENVCTDSSLVWSGDTDRFGFFHFRETKDEAVYLIQAEWEGFATQIHVYCNDNICKAKGK